MVLLSSCSSTRAEYVQTPRIPIPSHLLADCLPPAITSMMTWRDSLILNEQLLTVIHEFRTNKKTLYF
ncbi:Rz1-like lysis system protein LysC [Arsenophonus sp. PmNCSU2021_1]|uniref:Rz1-like lysis system protein LysC n=1 Tax=Arsenophonus sp. PmNCSU2021_1 TaxID=3118989 RepID=UPI003FA5CEE5